MLKMTSDKWYNNFWPVFIAVLFSLVIIACVAMVAIAVDGADQALPGPYQKTGLLIHNDTGARDRAIALDIVALLRLDSQPLQLALSTNNAVFPAQLRLDLIHPFEAKLDQRAVFTHLGQGQYRSLSNLNLSGRWGLLLQDAESHWLVSAQLVDAPATPVLKFDALAKH